MIIVPQSIVKKVKEIIESIPRQNGRRNWKAYPNKIVEVLLLQRESNTSPSSFFDYVGLPQNFKNFLKDEKIALAFNEKLISGTSKKNDKKVNRFMIVDELDSSLPIVQITLGKIPSVIVNPYSESTKKPPLESVLISQFTKPPEITFSSKTVDMDKRQISSFPMRTDRDLTQNLNSNPKNDDIIASIRQDLENKGIMRTPQVTPNQTASTKVTTVVTDSSNPMIKDTKNQPLQARERHILDDVSDSQIQPDLENLNSPYLSQSLKPWIKIDDAGNLIIYKRIQRPVEDSEEIRKLLNIPPNYTIRGKIITLTITRLVLRNSHEYTEIINRLCTNLPEDI